MSKMAELAYDIEQLYIDGLSAKGIAQILDVPVDQVLGWLEEYDLTDEEDASPFGTINS